MSNTHINKNIEEDQNILSIDKCEIEKMAV